MAAATGQPFSLADEETAKLLGTDWLKKESAPVFSPEEPSLSAMFWVLIVVLAVILFLAAILGPAVSIST